MAHYITDADGNLIKVAGNYGVSFFEQDWVNVGGVLTTSTANITIDLQSFLPSVSNNEVYEVLIGSYIYNQTPTLTTESYNAIYTDIVGGANNSFVLSSSSAQSSSQYKANGSIIVPVHRYIYTKNSSIDGLTLRIIAYRRIK